MIGFNDDYEDAIRKLWGDKIIDRDYIFAFYLGKVYIKLYSPLSLTVYHQKTYFPSVNQFVIVKHWRKPGVGAFQNEYYRSFNLGYLFFFYVRSFENSIRH